MKAEDSRALLARYTTGTLKPGEASTLMNRALQDQALFNELLDVEPVRAALEDPNFRAEIVADLQARSRLRERSWLDSVWLRWRGLVLVGAASAGFVLLFLFARPAQPPDVAYLRVELGSGSGSGMSVRELSVSSGPDPRMLLPRTPTPPGRPEEAVLGFDRDGGVPVYKLGNELRIGFKVSGNSSVVVTEERPDGRAFLLFPNRFQSSSTIYPGTAILIPPAGQGPLIVEGALGMRTVRMYFFPPTVNPMDNRVPWDKLVREAKMVARQYRVIR